MSDADVSTPPARRTILFAVLALLALAAVLGATLLLRSLANDPGETAATTVILEPADSVGDDPFTTTITARELDTSAPLGETIVARAIAVTDTSQADPLTHTRGVPATTPGLYGGSTELAVCDPDALLAFLAEDPAKAAAWASALGIGADAIATTLGSFTSVVLTVDALVTNHGFVDGAAVPKQSVLQAGTAVMVDPRGVPAVRCECGNPLLPPQLTGPLGEAATIGEGWDSLDLDRVVTVTAASADVTALTVADLRTGELTELRPASGSDAVYIATASDHARIRMTPDEPAASGAILTSPDGAEWSVALDTAPMLDVAVGDELAVAVGMSEQLGGAIHTSADGREWSPMIEVVDPLNAVAFGDGAWVAVGDRSFAEEGGAGDASAGVIYRSEDGETWRRVAETDPYENAELAGREELLFQTMTSIAYGDGMWIASATECAFRSCMRALFTSADTVTWARHTLDERIALIDLAHDGEQWAFVGGEPLPDPADSSEIDVPIGAAGTSPDGLTWAMAPTAPDRLVLTGLNSGEGGWLATAAFAPRTATDPPPGGAIYRSTDLHAWDHIGTAHEWTTSVAWFRPGASPAPATEAAATEPADPAEASTVRIMTAGLEFLDDQGATIAAFPYDEPAAPAVDALVGLLGEGTERFAPGDNVCTEDTTARNWQEMFVLYPGTDPSAEGWSVYFARHDSATVTIEGPTGVRPGDSFDDLRAAHPQAPARTVSHQGLTLDYVFLDVVPDGRAGYGVEVTGQQGTVSGITAPVYTEGEC